MGWKIVEFERVPYLRIITTIVTIHYEIGRFQNRRGFDAIYLVGSRSPRTSEHNARPTYRERSNIPATFITQIIYLCTPMLWLHLKLCLPLIVDGCDRNSLLSWRRSRSNAIITTSCIGTRERERERKCGNRVVLELYAIISFFRDRD